jgi:enoyl-CoA hydratase
MTSIEYLVDNETTARIKLNRPDKRNALSGALIEELHSALDVIENSTANVLLLEGNGRNFSAGFDFTDIETESLAETCWRFVRIQQLLERLGSSRLLTIAFAHGRNFGAGADLVAACKWRVCTPDATFRMPGLKFGLVLGTTRLAALVGAQNAQELLENSETFDASRARETGFATEISERDSWESIAQRAAQVSGNLAPPARQLLYTALNTHDYQRDMALLIQSLSVPGLKERIRKYLA